MTPQISAVIPAFNCAQFITSTVKSVFAQTVPINEIIIVNDGSTDETESVLKEFGNRVIYVEQENAGAAAARNRGIEVASGDWIAFLDADDLWLPEKLSLQLALLDRFPTAVLVYAPMQNVDETGEALEVWPQQVCEDPNDASLLPFWAALEQMPPTSTVMAQAEALRQVGGFGYGLRTAEDLDLWARLRALGPFVGVRNVLAYRRLRSGSLTDLHASSFQYLRYLEVVRRRRGEIEQWAKDAYSSGVCIIHTAIANAYMQEGRRCRQTLHAFMGVMRPHREWHLAAALLGEGILGPGLYARVIRFIKKNMQKKN